MVELIDVNVLEAVANTIADTGFDFDTLSKALMSYAGMNIAAFIHENDLRLGDFPTPAELVGSINFRRRRFDVERRVTVEVFDRLRDALITSDGKDFALWYMDDIIEAMRDVLIGVEEEAQELEDWFSLPTFDDER
jgi:hypothetical protein